LATEWDTDELNVIREHKEILAFLFASVSGTQKQSALLKVRPGLRPIAQKLRKEKTTGRFAAVLNAVATVLLALMHSATPPM
ncbi:MAG: hypothetical protein KDD44_00360, partial [Bdellovibrionales bacterium]|nr:hypothetical protein [Bdellovibrionales bacterium]